MIKETKDNFKYPKNIDKKKTDKKVRRNSIIKVINYQPTKNE